MNNNFYILNACPNCGDSRCRPFFAQYNKQILHPLYVKCSKCKLIFANPIASQETLENYYASQYYESGKIVQPTTSDLDKFREKIEYKVIQSLKKNGNFLEIGSGWGGILYNLNKCGFKVWGVEPSLEASNFCKSNGLHNIITESFEKADFANNKFSIVLAWHVIEHVSDVNQFLQKLHSLLENDGYAIIGTENCTNVRDFVKRNILYTRIPRSPTATEHTYYFSIKSLQSVLLRNGFKIIETRSYSEIGSNIFKNFLSAIETLFQNGTRQYQVIQKQT